MSDPDPAEADGQRRRALRRAALIAWTAFAFVVWNVVFDALVIQAGRDYLTRQALHQAGRGPAVTIRQVMYPEVSRAWHVATMAGGAIAAVGYVAVWFASRRRSGRLPSWSE